MAQAKANTRTSASRCRALSKSPRRPSSWTARSSSRSRATRSSPSSSRFSTATSRTATRPRRSNSTELAPAFNEALRLARSGIPVQIASDRTYRRRPSRAQIDRAFAEGATVYMPQIHQVLPRVARLMAALRAMLFGGGREEASFLFIVNGKGRQGMGLHHDGEVDSVWVQLEGRRTGTTGPPVPRGSRAGLDESVIRCGWITQNP